MPLTIRTQDGQEIYLEPSGQMSPEALDALFGGERPDTQIVGPSGSPLRDTATGRQLSPLSADELVAIGAAQRDPSTGQLVKPGGNPMTAERGFDTQLAQRFAAQIAAKDAEDRRQARRASRELQTAVAAVRNDQMTREEFDEVVGAIEKEHGVQALVDNPLYQDVRGIREQIAEQRQQMIDAEQQRLRTGPGSMIWDEDAGRPIIDPQWEKAVGIRGQMEMVAQKPMIEKIKTDREKLDAQVRAELKIIEANKQGFLKANDAQGAANYVQEAMRKLNAWQSAELDKLGGRRAESAQAVATARTGGQVAGPTHPKLPAGVSAIGSFTSVADVQATNAPPGSYAILAGNLIRRDATGRWVKAE